MALNDRRTHRTRSQRETDHCLSCTCYQVDVCFSICFHFTLPMGFFCLSPVVYISSPDYSRASAETVESWTTSKMSPPSAIFDTPPVIYKQISMSNQDHSLSPPCLMLKKQQIQNPLFYTNCEFS